MPLGLAKRIFDISGGDVYNLLSELVGIAGTVCHVPIMGSWVYQSRARKFKLRHYPAFGKLQRRPGAGSAPAGGVSRRGGARFDLRSQPRAQFGLRGTGQGGHGAGGRLARPGAPGRSRDGNLRQIRRRLHEGTNSPQVFQNEQFVRYISPPFFCISILIFRFPDVCNFIGSF
jgi:hypothetical protein